MKKSEQKKQRQKNEEKMIALIKAAVYKFDPVQLLDWMYNKCCNSSERQQLRDEMISLTTLEGGIYIKAEGLQEREKIQDFVSREIYPSYNEQKTHLFAY